MHLSLISLPRNSSRWQKATPYELHQALWKGFEGLELGERKRRFLYRHNEDSEGHSILVQSSIEPDWAALVDEAEGSTVRTRAFNPEKLPEGGRYRFLLRANPTVSRKYPDGSVRRIAVGSDRRHIAQKLGKSDTEELRTREEMLLDWLQRQGETRGFTIVWDGDRPLFDAGPNRDLIVRKRGKSRDPDKVQSSPITITTIDLTGVLEITDSMIFANALRHGVGRARAFGCGLISVAAL